MVLATRQSPRFVTNTTFVSLILSVPLITTCFSQKPTSDSAPCTFQTTPQTPSHSTWGKSKQQHSLKSFLGETSAEESSLQEASAF